MIYTIKQAAEKVHLTVHTLRYYDKEELLPFVERDSAGNRFFTDNDMEWLGLICCLKNTGMSIRQIKNYIQECFEGDQTLETRKQLLIDHREEVLRQMDELRMNLQKIEYKIAHYQSIQVHVENKKVAVHS
ncbi:MAG: MerR family transcriptional regulator [Vallitaleaceae bacterium]|nr:MerR family transcriptional regulator [Vallitaleaceae bacterium]